jgi:hypothetical protein
LECTSFSLLRYLPYFGDRTYVYEADLQMEFQVLMIEEFSCKMGLPMLREGPGLGMHTEKMGPEMSAHNKRLWSEVHLEKVGLEMLGKRLGHEVDHENLGHRLTTRVQGTGLTMSMTR